MSVSSLESYPTVPAFAMSDLSVDLFALHLSGNEYTTLMYLAGGMGPGNRVTINKSAIAAAIRISRDAVYRALATLRATRLLLDPDDGLPMINPVYFVHDPAERAQLVSRFGTEAVATERPGRRHAESKTPSERHLKVVR